MSLENFPPLYTYVSIFTCRHISLYHRLQLNPTTRTKQFIQWIAILGDKLQSNEFTLSTSSSIFSNSSINRSLSTEYIEALFQYLISQNLGELIAPGKIWNFRKPLSDWADLVHAWAVSSGKVNSVESVFSISNDSRGEPFYEMPLDILTKVLGTLESRNKCELMNGGAGVKFFA